ncbi:hypothetical protein MTR67_006425, partial [Solanum verrucosum]
KSIRQQFAGDRNGGGGGIPVVQYNDETWGTFSVDGTREGEDVCLRRYTVRFQSYGPCPSRAYVAFDILYRIDLIFPHEDEIAQNCAACRRVMLATGCIMVLLTNMVRRLHNELETNLADDLHTPTILKDAFQDDHKLINTYLISPHQCFVPNRDQKRSEGSADVLGLLAAG